MKENLAEQLSYSQQEKNVSEMRSAVEKMAGIFPDKDKKLWVPFNYYLSGLDIFSKKRKFLSIFCIYF